MLLRVDPQSSQPIFEQIVFQVKASIARGSLREGGRLPSVRELAKELAVNPNTVIRAYEALERDGVIVRRQGAGCFVSDKPSPLSDRERRRQLDSWMERLVTEAFHLGFEAGEIQRTLERALTNVRFSRARR